MAWGSLVSYLTLLRFGVSLLTIPRDARVRLPTVFRPCSDRLPTVFRPCFDRVTTVLRPCYDRVLYPFLRYMMYQIHRQDPCTSDRGEGINRRYAGRKTGSSECVFHPSRHPAYCQVGATQRGPHPSPNLWHAANNVVLKTCT